MLPTQAAIALADLGYKLFRLRSYAHLTGSDLPPDLIEADQALKMPLQKGWRDSPPATEEEIQRWDGHNYGIRCGEKGAGVIVLDADNGASVDWIRANMPPSPFVVTTTRGAHFYYRSTEIEKSAKLRGGDLAIDVIVNGYVVGPGSKRLSSAGRVFTGYAVTDPAAFEFTPEDLPPLLSQDLALLETTGDSPLRRRWLTVESLRPLVVQAHRTPEVFDWCFPSPPGTGNEAARSIIEFAIFSDRLSKEETAARLEVWNSRREYPYKETEYLLNWYYRKHAERVGSIEYQTGVAPAAETRAETPAEISPVEVEEEPETGRSLPLDLGRIPGKLGLYVDHYMATAPIPHPDLALFSALAFGSVAASRTYRTVTGLYSSLYLCMIAGTGVGKDYSKSLINRLLNEAGARYLQGPAGYSSPGALLSSLKRSPNHISIMDEFGDSIKGLKDRRNTNVKALWAGLRALYSNCSTDYVPAAYSREGVAGIAVEDHKVVLRPGVTILGLTTQRQLMEALGETDLENGNLNRFLFCVNESARRRPTMAQLIRGGSTELPAELVQWARAATDLRPPGTSDPVGTDGRAFELPGREVLVEYTPEAIEFIDTTPDLDANNEMFARFNENAQRVMLILAVSVDPVGPLITRDLAEWSVKYTRHLYRRFNEVFEEQRAASEHEQKLNAVETVIRKAGKAGLPEYAVKRKLKRYPPQELGRLLEQLSDLRLVSHGINHAVSKKPRWYHARFASIQG